MPQPQVYEGTAEEIARQIRDGNLSGRYRAIVVPEIDSESDGGEGVGETLLERLKGRVGNFDFGGANLSEDTGHKFTALLAEKHSKGQE
jgi:hypothetical protein